MAINIKAILAITLTTGILAGCSATGINGNPSANFATTTNFSVAHADGRDGRDRRKAYAVSLNGDQSREFLTLGREHFVKKNFGLAEKNFRKAVEIRSDNASAWLGLAASLDQLGQFSSADVAYEQVVELKPNNARVLNNMGYSNLLRGDYANARRLLNRAQSLDPHLEEVQGNIHLLEKTIDS